MDARYQQNQRLALCTAALLTPALRLHPAIPAQLAGRAAWLSPLAALPVLLLYGRFLRALLSRRQKGEALPELLLRTLPGRAGKAVLLVLSAWLLLYAGFTLRAGAQRLLVTIYPNARPDLFLLSLGLLSLYAALGSLRSLVRVAKLVLPVLLGILLLMLPMALGALERENLLPLGLRDAPDLLRGALACLDVLVLPPVLLGFFPSGGGEEGSRVPAFWLAGLCLLLFAPGLAVQGRMGPALTARLSQPFFTLVRNLVFLRSLERMEALVVSLWIFPDFLLCALLLQAAQRTLRRLLGQDPAWENEGRFSLERGRWVIWLCGAAAIGLGLALGRDAAGFRFWSERLIPAGNLLLCFGLLPLLMLRERPRRKQN